MASPTAISLDLDLSKVQAGLARLGGNLEKTFGKAVKAVDGKMGKLGESISNGKIANGLKSIGIEGVGSLKGIGVAAGLTVGAIVAVGGAALATGAKLAKMGKEAYDAFQVVRAANASLDRSLETFRDAQGNTFSPKQVGAFRREMLDTAEAISRAYGTSGAGATAALSQALRAGFDPKQAQSIVKLAANVMADPANKINSLEDATKKLNDVLNGSVDAAKELGIYVEKSDGSAEGLKKQMESVVSQLNSVYGGAPVFLDNSKRLADSFGRLEETIGETLVPFFDTVLTDAVQIVQGFISSGDATKFGREVAYWFDVTWETVKGIGTTLYGLGEWAFNIQEAIFANLHQQFKSFIQVVQATFPYIVGKLVEVLRSMLGDKISGIIGLDKIALEAENPFEAIKDAFGDVAASTKNIFDVAMAGPKFDSFNILDKYRKAGADAMTLALGTGGEVSAGATFLANWQEQNRKEKEAALKELTAKAEEISRRDTSEMQLTVGIKQVRGDRFRKVRRRG